MARKSRIESSDSVYHVINRGNHRSFIFKSEADTTGAKRSASWKLAIASKMNR